MIRRQMLTVLTVFVQLGCSQQFDMESIKSPNQGRAAVLVAFVTGYSDKPREVKEHRVLETLQELAGPSDALIIYHESMEYLTGNFVPQMRQRVTETPWYEEYEKRVLIGFSSGGTAALEFAAKQSDAFDTVILYAPYLGPQYMVDEIEAAGGLAKWNAPPPWEEPDELWLWIKEYGEGPMKKPMLYFLWSRDDELAPGLPLLRNYLPEERVIVGSGDHGWASFDVMWPAFIESHQSLFRP